MNKKGKGKTAKQTAHPTLVKQPNGKGALLTGGVPGNKGGTGRPSNAAVERCRRAADDKGLWDEARAKNPVALLAMAMEYSESRPAQQHKVDATVTFKAVRE